MASRRGSADTSAAGQQAEADRGPSRRAILSLSERLHGLLLLRDGDGLVVVAPALGIAMTGMAVHLAPDTLPREHIRRNAGVLAHPVGGGRDPVRVIRRNDSESIRRFRVERLGGVAHQPGREATGRGSIEARVFAEVLVEAGHEAPPTTTPAAGRD